MGGCNQSSETESVTLAGSGKNLSSRKNEIYEHAVQCSSSRDVHHKASVNFLAMMPCSWLHLFQSLYNLGTKVEGII